MSAQRKTLQEHVEIPGICFIRQEESRLRCILSAGHHGEFRHFYSGPLIHGFRAGTSWPCRPGETHTTMPVPARTPTASPRLWRC
ncbi:hypothetical protein [Streptomyces sp. NPDC057696]|uniref:hypothetical protein n=1 Tax=Streptomyces sp. NPDC057696 TaxID=3346218 RepID=UPI0036908940